MQSLSKHNVTPNFWGFNFRFVRFSGCLQKNFLKKSKHRINQNKGHFPSLHMLLDLCRKNEGNPFSTKIWVVGSYTDTLLSLIQRTLLTLCFFLIFTDWFFSSLVPNQIIHITDVTCRLNDGCQFALNLTKFEFMLIPSR